MDNRVVLQVPMTKELRRSAEEVALDYGFSSLQETIRLILNKLAKRELIVSVKEEKPVQLSAKNEKRYAKIIEDIKRGKNVTKTDSVDELFKLLRS